MSEPVELVPAPPQAKPAGSRSAQIIAWLVLALVVVVVAVGTSPFWAPTLTAVLPWGQRPAVQADNSAAVSVRSLENRLGAAETALKEQADRIARLEARPVAAPPAPAPAPTPAAPTPSPAPAQQSAASADAIKALQDQLAKLTADQKTREARIDQLESRIAASGEQGRAERAMLLALAGLRVGVEGSGPYTAELAAVQSLAGDRPEVKDTVAKLAEDAKTGLPSTASLTERFDRNVAPAILRARGNTKSGDWWQQIRGRLERLVVIRRIAPGGPAPRDATEAAVARADAALRAGDLTHAVAALDDLSGDAALAAAPWLAQAKRRLDAEAALAKLWRDEIAKTADGKSEGRP